MTTPVLLGTQGWSGPSWKGSFYPHGARPSGLLPIYSRAFPTVEVDSTFYTIPSEPVVMAWKEQTPPGFLFALKVPQEITHEKRFVDVDQRLTRFLHRINLLGERLGPLLLQLSADFRATEATRSVLERFIGSLSGEFRWAIEFRQPQWLTEETLELLRRANVALALSEGRWIKRGILLDLALEPTASFGYFRWNGAGRRTAEAVRLPADRSRELTAWAGAVRTLAERVEEVFGYFSDQFQGHAPASAREMQQALGIQPVDPSMLREQAELF